MCKPRDTHRSLKYNISNCSLCKLFVSRFFGFPAQNVGHFLVGFPVTLVFMRFWGAKKRLLPKIQKIQSCSDAKTDYEGKDKKTHVSVTFRFLDESVGSSDTTVKWK